MRIRKIKKDEINIRLTTPQHALIARLKETGLNMSSISRLAIRKFGDAELMEGDDYAKDKRVVIYMEKDDLEKLHAVADKKKLSPSETLRRLIGTYLEVNKDILNHLF
jgi:hypothetical protein